jgi:hypothetical protein
MARVVTSADSVTLALTRAERLEGFRGDIDAAVGSVRAVRASDDLWSELRGIRAPGTGIPRVVAVCTCRGSFGKDFAAVHGRGPGVVVEFDGEPFQRWVVSVDDPGRVVAEVSAAAGLTGDG